MEAAKRVVADENMKSGTAEAATSEETSITAMTMLRLGLGLRSKRVGRFMAATTRRATDMKRILMRCWALKKMFCGRANVYRQKRGEKGYARGRIWMLR
jgi:hypothetical protein